MSISDKYKNKHITELSWFLHWHVKNHSQSLIPWLLLVGHLSGHVINPVEKVTDHTKEAVEVTRVGQSVLALVKMNLEVTPGIDNFHLVLLNIASLLATIRNDQLGGLLLDRLDLETSFGELY